jgi:hypothetical protein
MVTQVLFGLSSHRVIEFPTYFFSKPLLAYDEQLGMENRPDFKDNQADLTKLSVVARRSDYRGSLCGTRRDPGLSPQSHTRRRLYDALYRYGSFQQGFRSRVCACKDSHSSVSGPKVHKMSDRSTSWVKPHHSGVRKYHAPLYEGLNLL